MESQLLLAIGAGVAIVILATLAAWLWRRRPRDTLAGVLKAIGIAARTDVSLPDGNGGLIHLEHLVFTVKGMVVLDVKPIDGVVFASDSMAEWTTIAAQRRFTFKNPQPPLLDRIAALKLIARDVPVTGHVVFSSGADFSKGRPSYVIQPDELKTRYAKPDQAELERVIAAFSPQWERVVAACEPSFRLAAS